MSTIVRFDSYEVDLAAGQLFKRGARVHLREQCFQVLAALLTQPGQVVTREELRRRLWPEQVFVEFDKNLNTAIARLREALNDSAEQPRFIETLPRHGYRFVGAIRDGVPAIEASGVARTRLLVLPFVNSSGDAAQEYFSDAVTDAIITALAALRSERLAVLARTTSMHLKRTRKDVACIGRELAVDYVVEGAVRRRDDRVEITVQLIRTGDQSHAFARRYEVEFDGLGRTEEDIARTIAQQLGGGSLAPESAAPALADAKKRPTENLAACNAYMKARYSLNLGTPEGFVKAKELFEDAVRSDPEFALAHDGLGEVYWLAGFVGFLPPREACTAGLFHALRAIEIDNTLAETHALIGQYRRLLDFNWAEVLREMKRALELDSDSPVVRVRYALSYLVPQGRLHEAGTEIQRAVRSDPLSVITRGWLAMAFWLERDYERAIDQARTMMEIDSTHPACYLAMGNTLCMAGRFEEAIGNLRISNMAGSPMTLGWLGLALAMGGHTAEARALLEQLHAMAARAYMPPTSFAWIHFGLGEIDDAFAWLDKAIDDRDHVIAPLKSYPFLDPIRDDPRFRALLARMNLTS